MWLTIVINLINILHKIELEENEETLLFASLVDFLIRTCSEQTYKWNEYGLNIIAGL